MFAHEWLEAVVYLYLDLDYTFSFFNNEMFLWRLAVGKVCVRASGA